jgi:hypothetical protein
MPLSPAELNALTDKLRARYDEHAKKFSPKWFDRTAFEQRLMLAVDKRMDLEGFILAEIANFEKTRERYDKKKNGKGSFTRKVDLIIEQNIARIKKYPEINFHSAAGIEIRHLYGALAELSQGYIPVLWLILDGNQGRNAIAEIENTLNKFALPRGTRPPAAIEDHILILNRKGISDLEIEKSRNNYLKESAFLLYSIMAFCDSFLTNHKLSALENPVRFDKVNFSPVSKKKVIQLFSTSTGYGALMTIRTYCEDILTDFRLTAFKPADIKRFTLPV